MYCTTCNKPNQFRPFLNTVIAVCVLTRCKYQARKKVATMIADAVLYGFSSCPFFSSRYTPHRKNDLVSDNTFFIFLRKKTQRKENIHICLCFKDLALKVPRVLNRSALTKNEKCKRKTWWQMERRHERLPLVKHESHGQAVANPHKDYVVPRIRRVEFLYA